MNNTRTRIICFMMIVMAAVLVVPAFAQDETESVVITEAQINESFRVNNPRRVHVSDLKVDLVPGEVVTQATYTFRNGESVTATATLTVEVLNGRAYWTVVNASTADGTISDSLLAQMNTSIESSWRNYLRGQRVGKLTDVTISETEITLTYAPVDVERPFSRRQ